MVERLEQIALQAQHGPWQGLGDAWRAFAADLDADLEAREHTLPLLKHRSVAHRERAQTIAQEHAAARALVEEIGRQIDRRRPRAATFELLAELLRGRTSLDDPSSEPGDRLS